MLCVRVHWSFIAPPLKRQYLPFAYFVRVIIIVSESRTFYPTIVISFVVCFYRCENIAASGFQSKRRYEHYLISQLNEVNPLILFIFNKCVNAEMNQDSASIWRAICT